MTDQEAFNTVLAKLREQKVASSDGENCMYQSDVGCCAVGHLLPAGLDLRSKGLNSVGAETLRRRSPEAQLALGDLTPSLLGELQFAHDLLVPMPEGLDETSAMAATRGDKYTAIGRSVANWEQEMQVIAARFNLNYTPNEVPA